MVNKIYGLFLACLIPGWLFAQSPGNNSNSKPIMRDLLPASPLLRNIVVDSINQRYVPHISSSFAAQQNTALHQLNDTARRAFYQYIAVAGGAGKLQGLQQQAAVLKDSARLRAYLDKKLRGFYAFQPPAALSSLMQRNAFNNQFKGATISAFTDNTAIAPARAGFSAELHDQLTLGNIPFDLQYTHLSGQPFLQPGMMAQELAKASFNKDDYMKKLSGYVNSRYDLKKYFLQDINVGEALKSYTGKGLQHIEMQMDSLSKQQTKTSFKGLISPEQLLYLDSNQLRNAVMEKGAGDSLQYELSKTYLQKINTLKQQAAAEGGDKTLLNQQSLTNTQVGNWINSGQQQKQAAKSLLPLNGIQKLFVNLQSLNLGHIAANGSKGTVSDLFMKGAQASFLGNNNKSLMLGAGVRQDAGSLKDAPFVSSLDPSGYSMQLLQMGKGTEDQPHSLIGAVNAKSKPATMQQFSSMALPRNIFVGTFSKQMKVGAHGNLDAELGKSSNSFSNATIGNDMANASKAAVLTLMNDFWQTFSAGITYSGLIDNWQLTHKSYLSYSGMAYNNPATPFSGKGAIRYGISLKRSFYKRKLSLGLKIDQRDMQNAAGGSAAWKSGQYAVDARYKLQRNISFTARINQAVMKNTGDKTGAGDFLTRQFSLSSQISSKLQGMPQNSNITLGVQQMNIASIHSVLVNMNLNHSIVLHGNVVSMNVFYNKDVRGQALYGNMLNSELSYNYPLGKHFNSGSGLTYLSDVGVVRQAGIRQTITATLGKALSVQAFVDARRNFLNTPQNYLYGTLRSELMLHYTF